LTPASCSADNQPERDRLTPRAEDALGVLLF
jgi:hypothetical protein